MQYGETVANTLALRSQVVPAQSQTGISQPEKTAARADKLKAETEEEIAAT